MLAAYNLRVFPSGDFSIASRRPVGKSGDNPLKGIRRVEKSTGVKSREVVYEAQPESPSLSELVKRFEDLDRRITIATTGDVDSFCSVLRYLYEYHNRSVPELLSALWHEYYELVAQIEASKKCLTTRSPRGSKGISSLGRKKLRSAVTILQNRHSRKNLSFVTYTVPTCDRPVLVRICEQWSEVVRQTHQNLFRVLKSKGLDPDIAGAIEIQSRRFDRSGYALPHLHIVCQGRTPKRFKNRCEWDVSIPEFEDCYRRAIENVAGCELDFRAACNVQRVKKDAANYLGKYLSKGSKDLERYRNWGEKLALPKAWYTCSKALLKAVREQTRNVGLDGAWVEFSRALDACGCLAFKGVYSLENGSTVALFGRCRAGKVELFVDRMMRFLLHRTEILEAGYKLTG